MSRTSFNSPYAFDGLDAYEAFSAAFDDMPNEVAEQAIEDEDCDPQMTCGHAVFSMSDGAIRCVRCGVSHAVAKAYEAAKIQVAAWAAEASANRE